MDSSNFCSFCSAGICLNKPGAFADVGMSSPFHTQPMRHPEFDSHSRRCRALCSVHVGKYKEQAELSFSLALPALADLAVLGVAL